MQSKVNIIQSLQSVLRRQRIYVGFELQGLRQGRGKSDIMIGHVHVNCTDD